MSLLHFSQQLAAAQCAAAVPLLATSVVQRRQGVAWTCVWGGLGSESAAVLVLPYYRRVTVFPR